MVSHSTTFKDLASFKDGFDIQGVNTYGTDPSLLVRLQNNTARVFCRWLAYFKNILAGGVRVAQYANAETRLSVNMLARERTLERTLF